jgi:hypothetical protein
MTRLVRIPMYFYIDHEERALDTPPEVKRTKRHVWIERDHPFVLELLSDANYYQDTLGFDRGCYGLCRSARATFRAIENSFLEDGLPNPHYRDQEEVLRK